MRALLFLRTIHRTVSEAVYTLFLNLSKSKKKQVLRSLITCLVLFHYDVFQKIILARSLSFFSPHLTPKHTQETMLEVAVLAWQLWRWRECSEDQRSLWCDVLTAHTPFMPFLKDLLGCAPTRKTRWAQVKQEMFVHWYMCSIMFVVQRIRI